MKSLNLLEGSILPRLLRLSGPLMGTAFIQMAYNLTDVAWIGRIGTEAVAAAGQVGFLIWIGNGIMLIPRVGMSVLAAQLYGGQNHQKLKLTLNNGFWYALVLGIIYGISLLLFQQPLIQFYGLDESVNRLTATYLVIIAMGMPLFFINPVLSANYNSLGDSRTPFILNTIGLIFNMVGDPLLIFGWGPIPAMGIAGAAYATVLAQFLVFLGFMFVIRRSNNIISQSGLHRPLWDWQLLKEMSQLGLPVSLQSLIHAGVSVVMSLLVASFGAMPLAVASVGSNIESISWMTTEGFAAAITAFTGQNYGAGRMARVRRIYQRSMQAVGVIGIFATAVLFLFRFELFSLFIPHDADAIALGAVYLLIFSLSQFFMSIEIGGSGFLNGLGETRLPAVMNSIFNLMRLPLAWFLMQFWGVAGIWLAMSLSSVIKGIIIFIATRRRLPALEQASRAQELAS